MKRLSIIFMLLILITLSACNQKPTPLTPEQRASYAFLIATQELDSLFETHAIVEAHIPIPINFESLPGLEILWTSSERSIISDYGVFNRPNVDIEITMRATMVYGGFVYNKTYTLLAKALVIEDEDPVEKPEVPYESVLLGLQALSLHAELKDANGTYIREGFYGIHGVVVGLNGLNQALLFSEGAYIIVEGLLGVEVLSQDLYYNISGHLMYDGHMPKLKIDAKLSTIEWLDIVGFDEPEYIYTELSVLTQTKIEDLLTFARAVIIEGYINHFVLTDAYETYQIDISADYDQDLNGRYVQIEAIVYFDPSENQWVFVEDTFKIKEILAPCPLC